MMTALCGLAGLLLLLTGFVSISVSQETRLLSKTEEPIDPLRSLNNNSQALYALAKQNALARLGPIIIVAGDDLVLRNGTQRVQVRFIPELYHTLKTFDHITLAIDVTLTAHVSEDPLGEDVLGELRDYRKLFPAAAQKLESVGLDAEQRERQRAILEASSSFLASVIKNRRCSSTERIVFMRKMNPLILTNAVAAARAAIDALHRQVNEWQGQIPPDQWNRLMVIVIGKQLPRNGNLAVQYFAHLLGEKGEGERITYAEGLGDEPRALDLLATRLVDTQVGIDFFNDPLRMHRDLLSDGARDYLSVMIDAPESHRAK
jgi:hypothetical protein